MSCCFNSASAIVGSTDAKAQDARPTCCPVISGKAHNDSGFNSDWAHFIFTYVDILGRTLYPSLSSAGSLCSHSLSPRPFSESENVTHDWLIIHSFFSEKELCNWNSSEYNFAPNWRGKLATRPFPVQKAETRQRRRQDLTTHTVTASSCKRSQLQARPANCKVNCCWCRSARYNPLLCNKNEDRIREATQ
jgi:hypothetical protein